MDEIQPQEIGHVVLRVRNLERSTPFYEMLGFRKIGEIGGMMAFFTATGENHHDLGLQAVGDDAPSPPPHAVGLYHVAIRLPSDDHVRAAFRTLANAGADIVGGEEMVKKIQEGWTDFEAVIATPDMMKSVGRLGKILGPRGLMPNPKAGTVTFDVKTAIQEVKAGKVEFRVDKTAIIHTPVGKASFPAQRLVENAQALIAAVVKAKPVAAKGKYVRSITLSSTMGPGIPIDLSTAEAHA